MKENENDESIQDESNQKLPFNPLLNNVFGTALINQGYLSK